MKTQHESNAYYAAYGVEVIAAPRSSWHGPESYDTAIKDAINGAPTMGTVAAKLDATDLAINAMRLLDFRKVKWNCVYTGNVTRLVSILASLGWVADTDRPNNPFLLIHPQTCMTFNFALNETTPDDSHIAFFRGYRL